MPQKMATKEIDINTARASFFPWISCKEIVINVLPV